MRVALYLRRSTNEELQADSLAVQEEILRKFATEHAQSVGLVFRESASGRDAEGREQFLRLIEIVTTGRADFDAILVRDVSRWGRFDNADEAAYYDFLCLRHHVEVIYVEESFGRDVSPYAALMKVMKRVQAAEFSREKSRIIRYGKRRGAEHGFRVGAPPPYGMKRVLVHPDGTWIQDLPPKVHKLVSAVKTKLAPSRDESAAVVRKIFDLFANRRLGYSDIARGLMRSNVPGPRGGRWYAVTVRYLIANEAYAGIARHRTGDEVIQVPGAHEPVVAPALFERAAARAVEISHALSQTRKRQLAAASAALDRWGHLPADLLIRQPPSATQHIDIAIVAENINQICANIVADEKMNVMATLRPRFSVEDRGDTLMLDNVLSIAVVVGFTRRDLVGDPIAFRFPAEAADLLLCIGLDPELRPMMRCLGRGAHVRGKSLLRHPLRRSKSLPAMGSGDSLVKTVARWIHRTAAAETWLLKAAQKHQTITFSGLSREVGWPPAAVRRTYIVLRERGEPLPELMYEPGRRNLVICSVCGGRRSLVPSSARALKSDLCGRCARRRSSSGKLRAICAECEAERFVWPYIAKKMRDGLQSLCHTCSLAKGRAITLARNRSGAEKIRQKHALLRDIGLLTVRAMAARASEFVRPTLWSEKRRRLATIRWHSNVNGDAHRLTLDCDEGFVARCVNARDTVPRDSIAEAILDRNRWCGGSKDLRGDRVWLVRLL